MSEKNEGFLSRWSRRKRTGGADPAGAAPAEPVAATPAQGEHTEATPETADQTPPDLPDIDSLDKDSDYTAFLREGVPEQLKNQALRKLWRSDPVLANVDGLNDYDDDYTKMFTAAVTKSVKTAFKVGKGMVDPDAEEAEAADATDAPASTPRTTAGKRAGKRAGKATGKPAGRATGKAAGKAVRKPAGKAARKPA